MRKSGIICVLVFGVIISLSLLGCSAQRKPITPVSPPAPSVQNQSRLPANPTELSKTADGLAREAAGVQGVSHATVVLTYNTALVGLNLKSGADANTVKREVSAAIKKSSSLVKNVLVTTDPELKARLVHISKGIAEGRPVGTFQKEITELRNRLSPSAR